MLDPTADFNDQRHPASEQTLSFSLPDRQQFHRGRHKPYCRMIQKGRHGLLSWPLQGPQSQPKAHSKMSRRPIPFHFRRKITQRRRWLCLFAGTSEYLSPHLPTCHARISTQFHVIQFSVSTKRELKLSRNSGVMTKTDRNRLATTDASREQIFHIT